MSYHHTHKTQINKIITYKYIFFFLAATLHRHTPSSFFLFVIDYYSLLYHIHLISSICKISTKPSIFFFALKVFYCSN
ncbi:hypothetical protein BDC45DRAFT_215121 [Circinella umbellata]|nr:hypothetical protein BDC45DRAFT_215121 [Circinella umbellata]